VSERDGYNPGEFCWVDLSAPSTEAGAAFYGKLMGWDWEDGGPEANGYGDFTFRGKAVAGMGPIRQQGQPPAWASYVCTDDADATVAKIRDAGGSVLAEPADILSAGRLAICRDPQGAVFGLWQPNEVEGAELVNEVGSWTWNQLATTDVKAAEKFYGEVFGWKMAQPELADPDSPYFNWAMEGSRWDEGIGGVMPLEGNFPDGTPPFWIVHHAVPDAAGAIETAKSAGGQALTEVLEIPVGKLAALMDDQGAVFSVIEPDYPEPR
jgi:predicted enzyme related to lactoylglutathione lyase